MITFKHKGNFSKTERFLERAAEVIHKGQLDKYGRAGVEALAAATPVDTGKTAESWEYKIQYESGGAVISFNNTNIQNGVNVAILLQYGHGTRNGGYVQGRDYINPAIRPIFDKIANDAWEEVTKK